MNMNNSQLNFLIGSTDRPHNSQCLIICLTPFLISSWLYIFFRFLHDCLSRFVNSWAFQSKTGKHTGFHLSQCANKPEDTTRRFAAILLHPGYSDGIHRKKNPWYQGPRSRLNTRRKSSNRVFFRLYSDLYIVVASQPLFGF